MDLGLKDRRALVAAASKGIGLASATALAREGARVAICGRDRSRLEAARAGIAEVSGSEVVAVVADVATEEGAARFVHEGAEALGGCEVLVTNAGGPPPGRAADMSDDDYRAALELNFLSTVRMVREALPHMRRAGFGRIVAIGSSSMKEPIRGLALSNSARGAATGFLKTLAWEVAPEGITVNAVLPGRVRTDRLRVLAEIRGVSVDEELAAQAADVPIGRLGEPIEIGDVVAFLASERASYLTGAMVSVDGGLLRGLF